MTTSWQEKIYSVSIRKKEKWHYAQQELQKYITPTSKCLDVGSGVGTLSMLQERMGGIWEYTETDSAAAEETRKVVKGKVYCIDIFSDELRSGSYDIITVFDVIEHVPDPQAFMDRLYDLLAPKGVIILTTPADDGGYYFWRRLAENAFGIDKEAHGHVVEGFSPTQLRTLSTQTHLTVQTLRQFSFAFTEMVELAYNGAYILKNRKRQKTGGYNLALSPASGADANKHTTLLIALKIIYPVLRAISLFDRLGIFRRGYEWLLVAQRSA